MRKGNQPPAIVMAIMHSILGGSPGNVLPPIPGGLKDGMGVRPADEEEYNLLIQHAIQHGVPVHPSIEDESDRDFEGYPKLMVVNGHLSATKAPDNAKGADWVSRDDFFKAVAATSAALKKREKAGKSKESKNGIVIPDGMSKLAAAQELERMHDEEMKVAEYRREFSQWYWQDVLVAARKAVEHTFGWLDLRETAGGFMRPAAPPKMVDVCCGIAEDGSRETERGLIGRVGAAPWGEDAYIDVVPMGPYNVHVVVRARKKNEDSVNELFDAVDRVLREESVFKGKALLAEWRSPEDEPAGLHLEVTQLSVNPNIVLSEKNQGILDLLVKADLESNDKRIYLLKGAYGNGKTETAMSVAQQALGMGYTFFNAKTAGELPNILLAAKRYAPAMVFMEDVDAIASGEERTEHLNEVLNTLDGMELKKANIKIVFTTNHPDRLNSALRRPGRIDLVMQFDNPDAKAKREIISRILGGVKGFKKLDLDGCVKALPDVGGSFVAEICKRAATYGAGGITMDIFTTSIDSMLPQIEMFAETPASVNGLANAMDVIREHITGRS